MIRSCRIPAVLRRICGNNTEDTAAAIQVALLVSTDGELLGSTATTFVGPDGTSESIESLGALIADIAVDYSKLGEEYANLDPPNYNNNNTTIYTAGSSGSVTGASVSSAGYNSANNSANNSPMPNRKVATPASTTSTLTPASTPIPNMPQIQPSSHLQCLLLELELGLVAVSMCRGVDCMVIAICSPNAPLGMVKARLQTIVTHVQEALAPVAMSSSSNSSGPQHPVVPSYR